MAQILNKISYRNKNSRRISTATAFVERAFMVWAGKSQHDSGQFLTKVVAAEQPKQVALDG
ncbi:hypothetical protein, partial [Sphingorhabdus sp.]|uniref:hypothetical protein n=1 Tax=Sphingorhabdus sp. TaxID=1902408 RepID=UPI0032B7FAEE